MSTTMLAGYAYKTRVRSLDKSGRAEANDLIAAFPESSICTERVKLALQAAPVFVRGTSQRRPIRRHLQTKGIGVSLERTSGAIQSFLPFS
jgi:hypothetical protein